MKNKRALKDAVKDPIAKRQAPKGEAPAGAGTVVLTMAVGILAGFLACILSRRIINCLL